MSQDPNPPDPYAEFAKSVQLPVPDRRGGCAAAVVIFWAVALILVGVLIMFVTGTCSFMALRDSDSTHLFRDIGDKLILGFIIGLALCLVGYAIARGSIRNR